MHSSPDGLSHDTDMIGISEMGGVLIVPIALKERTTLVCDLGNIISSVEVKST